MQKYARPSKRKQERTSGNIIRETIMASKSLKKITLLDKQGREIQDQDKSIEPQEEFYTKLCHSEQSIIIHTDPKEVLEITS